MICEPLPPLFLYLWVDLEARTVPYRREGCTKLSLHKSIRNRDCSNEGYTKESMGNTLRVDRTLAHVHEVQPCYALHHHF